MENNQKNGFPFGDIFSEVEALLPIDYDEPLWDKLIQQIIDGNVIPVIGPDFLTDDKDNPHKLVVDFLAKGFRVDSCPNSFSDLIYDPNYMKSNRSDNIYYFVNKIFDKVKFDPSLHLIKLLATRQFPFVITTSFTPIVEQAMKDIWKDELKVMRFTNNPIENNDIRSNTDLRTPTVYYMFGKAGEGVHKYALTDIDIIDYVSSWLSNDYKNKPRNLCEELKSKYLLFVGFNYSDWLFRFIWHSLHIPYFGRGMYISDSIEDTLLRFLEQTETFIKLNIDNTIEQMVSRLNKKLQENEATKFDKPKYDMDIFISYSRSNLDIAEKLYVSLTAQGKRVWYDRNNLTEGANFMEEIRKAIRTAKYFIPILSENITKEEGDSHVYRNEWDTAIDVAISMGRTYIIPLAEVGFDFYKAAMPEKIQQCNTIFFSKDDNMDKIAEKIIHHMNKD